MTVIFVSNIFEQGLVEPMDVEHADKDAGCTSSCFSVTVCLFVSKNKVVSTMDTTAIVI